MNRLRVALVAGTLGQGGAEKQFVYMATALAAEGADVRTYTMTRGEYHGRTLDAAGMAPTWVGRSTLPPVRAAALTAALARFRPHVIQAGHFFTNLYVTIAARLTGAAAVGAIRSDVHYELATHGRLGPWSLRAPPDIITNSWTARNAAEQMGRDSGTVHVVPNAIDLPAFDQAALPPSRASEAAGPVALAVGSLLRVKRFTAFWKRSRSPGGGMPVCAVRWWATAPSAPRSSSWPVSSARVTTEPRLPSNAASNSNPMRDTVSDSPLRRSTRARESISTSPTLTMSFNAGRSARARTRRNNTSMRTNNSSRSNGLVT